MKWHGLAIVGWHYLLSRYNIYLSTIIGEGVAPLIPRWSEGTIRSKGKEAELSTRLTPEPRIAGTPA